MKIKGINVKIPPNCPFFNIRCGKPYFSVSWSKDEIEQIPLSKAFQWDDLGPVIGAIARHYWLEEADKIKTETYHELEYGMVTKKYSHYRNAQHQALQWVILLRKG